ncbi:MAG: ATP-binding cassette domain-containing protein [Chloroflexi bacterium]|nr:ATP-binding cassette domain-containing protein [Chloroflexota bacterium]
MNDICLRIHGLNVSYDGHTALKNIYLDIPHRQITAIIGPSGCGKTTLLRSINRLIDLTDGAKIRGEIWLDGHNVMSDREDVTSIRKRIGLISQKPSPLPMSIYDNVAYGPRIHGMRDRKELDKTVRSCLETAGLWTEVKDRLQSPATRLSVGQQQRLCLARSLAVRPEVLLCDEPTSALDPVSSQNIENRLIELKKDYTIVIVTHNIHQAMRLADYVVHLYLGELVEHGPASEVFQRPKQDRTRAYINGTVLTKPRTDVEINLKGKVCPLNFVFAKAALENLEIGQVLKVIVDYPTAITEVPRAMEYDGHKVLGVKQLNETDWEVIIQKRE